MANTETTAAGWSFRSRAVATMVVAVVAGLMALFRPEVLFGDGGCPSWLGSDGQLHLKRSRVGVMKRIPASELTSDLFQDLVSRGEPFVMRSAFDTWPAMQQITNCSALGTLYPDLVYHDWQGGTKQSLGSVHEWQCQAGYLERDSDDDWGSNPKSFKHWLSSFPVPPFMPEHAFGRPTTSSLFADETSMSVFLGMPGTGVTPHLDENCESFISIQFCGRKRWTVSSPELVRGDGSGGVMELRWSDPMAVDLERGDAIVWYMSQVHHTEVLEGCSVSASVQFSQPGPHRYYRNLWQLYDNASDAGIDWRRLYRSVQTHNDSYFSMCDVQRTEDGAWHVGTKML